MFDARRVVLNTLNWFDQSGIIQMLPKVFFVGKVQTKIRIQITAQGAFSNLPWSQQQNTLCAISDGIL